MKARWNRKATSDYNAIVSQLNVRDAALADRFALRIAETVVLIAANPRIGSLAEHLKSDVPFFVVEPYVLYYPIQRSTVRILRLLHGSQDAACKLDC
jgi:plasmid stabilization system protein ParE